MLDVLRLSYDRPTRHPAPEPALGVVILALAAAMGQISSELPRRTRRHLPQRGERWCVGAGRREVAVSRRAPPPRWLFDVPRARIRSVSPHHYTQASGRDSHGGVERSLGLLPFAAAASGNRTRAPGVRLLAPCAGLRLPFGRAPPTSSPVLTSHPVSRGERWPVRGFARHCPTCGFDGPVTRAATRA